MNSLELKVKAQVMLIFNVDLQGATKPLTLFLTLTLNLTLQGVTKLVNGSRGIVTGFKTIKETIDVLEKRLKNIENSEFGGSCCCCSTIRKSLAL